MSVTIGPDAFAGELTALLRDATEEVRENAAKAVRSAARSMASDLRSSSPQDRGEYAGGWTATDTTTANDEGCYFVVHNRAKPTLTHLLEEGHEQWYMGRDLGYRTAGRPHIAPAFEKARSKFLSMVEGGGGGGD